jgi:FAD/FMN-containing dehydrogenase/Fe-S oxidoreductase
MRDRSGTVGDRRARADLQQELKAKIQGEVRWDALSRELYSTDASIYRVEPLGVVLPRSEEDVVQAVRLCRQHGASITARGAGTSLAGQAVGPGVQLDFSRHLGRILEVDVERRFARVQPGVVLDELNRALGAHGLQFGPDVATGSHATLGGMIANNSSGARSLLHGLTADHVRELLVVLSDGSRCRLRALSGKELEARKEQQDLEGRLYRFVPSIARENADQIRRRFPSVKRRVSGYNLDAFLDPSEPVDLCRLVAGSEGTLALVLEATLALVPVPRARTLVLVQFADVPSAAAALPLVLEHGPAAVELVDNLILEQTRGMIEHDAARGLLDGDPGALLLVEFCGDEEARVADSASGLVGALRAGPGGAGSRLLDDAGQQARIWALRKAGVGLLMGIKGDAKPHAFVEDTAVGPEKLADYIGRFYRIVEAHHTRACWYGHAGAGCLHVRPVLDLKSVSDREALRSIMDQVSDLVLEFGGALSGEHGDGIVRGAYLEKMFGDQLYRAFRRVKAEFDPDGVLNPGRMVDAPDPLQNLRSLLDTGRVPDISTAFDYSAEGGFYRAVEMCSGVGHCRKTVTGVMCPSYMVTLDEAQSTRGRANALRAAMEGRLKGGLAGEDVRAVLDTCLSCKACKSECPSQVDMARFKSEALDLYRRKYGLGLRDLLTAYIDRVSRLAGLLAPLSNTLLRTSPARWLAEKLLGFDRRRELPRFVRKNFRQRFASRHPAGGPADRPRVVLFVDCWTDRCEPELGLAAVSLLEVAGYAVEVTDTRCCGRAAISKGHLQRAGQLAAYNVQMLHEFVRAGCLVVGIEPSCLLTLRDEYPALLRGRLAEQAREVAGASLLIEELLARLPDETWARLALRSAPFAVLVHGHCHQKSLSGMKPLELVLERVPDIDYKVLDASCCGMAGSFGYEVEHYELSRACAERVLAPAVRESASDSLVLAPGFSCRRQIEHFTGRHALHPVAFLAGLLPPRS